MVVFLAISPREVAARIHSCFESAAPFAPRHAVHYFQVPQFVFGQISILPGGDYRMTHRRNRAKIHTNRQISVRIVGLDRPNKRINS